MKRLGGGDVNIWQVPIRPVVDFNADGIVDVQDLVVLTEHLFGEAGLVAHCVLDETDFAVAQENSDPVSVISNAITPLDKWILVAVCLDGSEAAIYIDGQLDASTGYDLRIPSYGCRLRISSLGRST